VRSEKLPFPGENIRPNEKYASSTPDSRCLMHPQENQFIEMRFFLFYFAMESGNYNAKIMRLMPEAAITVPLATT
jgi:hypothetical protein